MKTTAMKKISIEEFTVGAFLPGVMLSDFVSKLGKGPIVFVEEGAKIIESLKIAIKAAWESLSQNFLDKVIEWHLILNLHVENKGGILNICFKQYF